MKTPKTCAPVQSASKMYADPKMINYAQITVKVRAENDLTKESRSERVVKGALLALVDIEKC